MVSLLRAVGAGLTRAPARLLRRCGGGSILGSRLTTSLRRVASLAPHEVDEMWRLFTRYYDDVGEATFRTDLAAKSDVILMYDVDDGRLQGFSTQHCYHETISGREVGVIFSGDTVVAESYWGQNALQRMFYLYLWRCWLAQPTRPLYWFLISKGYRTYLLLTRNYLEFWPRHDRATPSFERAVLDHLCTSRFGDAYRADQGVLRFDTAHGRLREEVAPIDEKLLEQPDIRFFVESNPGHAHGDELCCLGLVDLRFLLHWIRKYATWVWSRESGRRSARSSGG